MSHGPEDIERMVKHYKKAYDEKCTELNNALAENDRLSNAFKDHIAEIQRAGQEIDRLKDLARRLASGWDMERVYEFGGKLTFDEINWPHWEMIKDSEVLALFPET
jgi:hypothetical protein